MVGNVVWHMNDLSEEDKKEFYTLIEEAKKWPCSDLLVEEMIFLSHPIAPFLKNLEMLRKISRRSSRRKYL